MAEGKVAVDPVAIDAPGGFLFEWWSVFWDIFIARTNEMHSEVAAAYLEAQQIKAREHQQQMQMQQLQLIQHRHAQLQRTNASHPSLNGPMNALNSDGILGPSTASVLAAKMYEERLKNPHSMDPEGSQLLDASRMALFKSAATNHAGQLVPGTPGNVSTTLQQIQARNQQTIDIKSEGNMGVAQRSLPMDPSSLYGQGIIQPKPGLGGAGLNQGVSSLPLKGWPLTQQQFLAQAQAQGNLINSSNYGDLDPRRLTALNRGGLNGKDGQPAGTDGCISSTMQSTSPKVRSDQEYLMKVQQASSQQPQEQLQNHHHHQQQNQQQQMQQSNRKRKQPTSSGAANSTGTGNTVGPSANSPPSTPSTHTLGDGLGMAGNMSHDDLEQFDDVGSLDDNVGSFLANDDGDARDIFAALKRSPAEPNPAASKGNFLMFVLSCKHEITHLLVLGFTFSEVNCCRTNNSKVVYCHFSSDGKILASAGHEKKAVLWNMDTFQTQYTSEEHNGIITDVRFKPNSTQLATSSFDRTIKLWNAADPGFSLHTFTGHGFQVTSLEFHPKKIDLLCSCDGNGEIRYWDLTQLNCMRTMKGGTAQVRFQPNTGQFLAAAAENVVSIFDVETHSKKYTLQQGHITDVQSVCWDSNRDLLASVSQDLVKVWSISSGECIHEVSSNGNKFHSCVFHPSYANLLIIGGYQSLELWNMVKNQSMTIQAHEGLIAALAQSPASGMVASASHDNSVKLWK
ncbi:hypothetical protein ABZP36_032795 [Zizania latifolia]